MIEFFSNPYYYWYFVGVLTVMWSPVRYVFHKVGSNDSNLWCIVFYLSTYLISGLAYGFNYTPPTESVIDWAPRFCWALTGVAYLSIVIHVLIQPKKP